MDVLTDVLHVLRFQGRLFCRMELSAPWAVIDTPAHHMAQFHLVERGSCWLHLPHLPAPIPLVGGDFIMIMGGTELVLMSEIGTIPSPFGQLGEANDKRVITYGGGGQETKLLCGAFILAEETHHPLLSLLPSLIHIKGTDGMTADWLAMIIQQISAEKGFAEAGAETLVGRLIDILFIHVLRHWIKYQSDAKPGWLMGLRDPIITIALGEIHAHPQYNWTIEGLAQKVGLSRSAFANRFTQIVGEPPLTYISRWRIQLALNYLKDPQKTLDEVAQLIGYESVYSFSKAFKRQIGVSPGSYRKPVVQQIS